MVSKADVKHWLNQANMTIEGEALEYQESQRTLNDIMLAHEAGNLDLLAEYREIVDQIIEITGSCDMDVLWRVIQAAGIEPATEKDRRFLGSVFRLKKYKAIGTKQSDRPDQRANLIFIWGFADNA